MTKLDWNRKENQKTKSKIRGYFVDWSNMLTFGKYKGKYLKDIPEYWLKSALPFVEDKKWNKEIIKIKEELKRRNIKKH